MALNTNIYIDGLNLYYGSLRSTHLKWLDIGALCARLLPGHNIKRIRYFTARVLALPHDPDAPVRQDIYLRALRTVPNLQIHDESRFAERIVLLPQFPLAYIQNNYCRPPQKVQVQRLEEKRTDVNLASWLLYDCCSGDFDKAVVVSNDSDLSQPIEIVTSKYGKEVGIINPHPKEYRSKELCNRATWYMRTINKKALVACQFPLTLTDVIGAFAKPPSW